MDDTEARAVIAEYAASLGKPLEELSLILRSPEGVPVREFKLAELNNFQAQMIAEAILLDAHQSRAKARLDS